MSKVTTTLLISFFCFIVTVYGAPLLSSEQGIERTADTPANYGNSYDSGNGYTLTYMLQPHIPFIPIGSPSVASSISYAANQYAQALSNANAISFLGGNATAHTNATVQGQLAFSNATATASGLGLVETDAATSSGSSYSGNIEIAFTVGGFGGAGPFGMALFGSYPSSGSSRFLLHNARKAGDIF
ncbi:hypothetical protein Gasu2_19110 [Galdieria sulphuraria]|nr:hypothetical protein Gasu2_19110 [Galdieria sulphuraria]